MLSNYGNLGGSLYWAKSFLLKVFWSQLIYILTPLPTYTEALQKVNKLLFRFLWDSKGDKIKREFIKKNHKEGGLRMIDINTFKKCLLDHEVP